MYASAHFLSTVADCDSHHHEPISLLRSFCYNAIFAILTRLQYISVELCICTATVASCDCHHVSVKSCVAEQSVLEPHIKMTASVVRIDHCQISGWIWSAVSHSGPPLLVEKLWC